MNLSFGTLPFREHHHSGDTDLVFEFVYSIEGILKPFTKVIIALEISCLARVTLGHWYYRYIMVIPDKNLVELLFSPVE